MVLQFFYYMKGCEIMAGTDLGSIVAHLKLEMNDFNNNLNKAMDEIGKTDDKFRGLKSTGEALSSVGAGLTAGVTAPVMALGASVVKTQMNFQDAMANVQALSGATGSELKMLEDTAKQMGESTVFSASECADALGYMALAGWDANQSAAGLPGVLNLAAASGMELAQASDLVTDYLTAFGLEADQAGRMADVLSYAQANSNTTTQMLGDAFKNCAVNAHNAGMTLEETTAILGKLADSGLKGSEAGTALNAVIRDMTQKMQNGNIQIGNTKVAVQDANGNFRKMTDIVADVTKATEGMGDAEKTAALMSTFTADSIKAMGIMCNTGADSIDGFTKELENSEGSAKKTADTMNNTLSGSIKELGSAWEGLQLSLGDTTGVLTGLIKALTKVVRFIKNLPGPVKQFIITLAMLAAAVGPTILIIGKMITTFIKIKETMGLISTAVGLFRLSIGSKLVSAFSAVSSFVTGSVIPALSSLWGVLMANPIILVIAVIAALVAAFIWAWNNVDGFKEGCINAFNAFKEGCINAFNAVINFFTTTLPTWFNNVVSWFQQLPSAIGKWLLEVVAKVALWAINMHQKAQEVGTKFITAIINFITQLPAKIWYWLCYIVAYVALWTAQMISKAREAGSQFIQNIINWFTQLPYKIKMYFDLAVTHARKWLHDMTTKAKEAGSKFVHNVITWLQQLPGKVWNWLVSTITRVATWASQMASKAQQAGSRFLQRVVSFMQQLPGRVWSFLSQTIQKAISFATQFAQKGMQAAKNFASKIKSGLANLPGQMVSIGKNIIQGIVNGVTSGASSLFNAMSNIAHKALNSAKEALGIHSPSRVFANEVGKYIPEGISVGIKANAGNTLKSIRDYANSLVEEIDTNKFLGKVNLATSGININTEGSNNANLIAAFKQYTQAIIDNKQDFDYGRMGTEMGKAVAQQNTPIIMDKTLVGQKVASTVKRANDYFTDQQARFRGDKDYV